MNTNISKADRPSLKSRVVKGFFWLIGLTFLGQIITWAVTIIVIRLLEPEDYGLMAMATVFMGFLVLLNEVGLGSAIIQKADIKKEEIKNVFGLIIIINIGLVSIVLILAPLVGIFFSSAYLVTILRVLSINFILTACFVIPQSLLMREFDFRKKSSIDLIGNLCSSAVVLALALLSFGVWALVFGMIAMNLFKVIAFNSIKKYRYWPTFSIKGICELITFGGYVSITRILWFFYSQSDIIIAGRLFGKEVLGIYSVAMNLVSIPLNKLSPLFIQIGLPAFSKIQDDIQAIHFNFLRMLQISNLFSFPFFFGLALVLPDAVPLILGSKWKDIILPMQILCVSMPLRFISILFPPVVTGLGRPDVIMGNMIFAIITMPLAFYVGSRWGLVGLCYAWVTAFPVLFFIMLMRTIRTIGVPFKGFLKTLIIPLFSSIIMGIILSSFRIKFASLLDPLWLTIVMIIMGIILYFVTILLLNRNILVEIRSFFVVNR